MYQALATGLLFARFARPTASILFSRHAVVAPYSDGQRADVPDRQPPPQRDHPARSAGALQRHGAGRPRRHGAALLAAAARAEQGDVLSAVLDDRASDRRRRARWRARRRKSSNGAEAEILVLLSGIDEAFEQTVHARSSYRADEIVWNARFQSMFLRQDARSRMSIDITRVHDIERLPD